MPDRLGPDAAAATRALAVLQAQADALRAEIARLRQELAPLQITADSLHTAQLLEVNERLVVAALDAKADADDSAVQLAVLAHSSQRDVLTDTPNRQLLVDRTNKAIGMARRHGGRSAVMFVDMDGFKSINDTLGHVVGDRVLQWVARALESAVRDSDTISRYGGDEFLVLLAEVKQASDAALIAAKMLAALAIPCEVGGQTLELSASIGIALYPEDGEDTTTLIQRADAAMYRAKNAGPGSFAFHGVPA